MGNNNTRTIARFLQSSNDFPCSVELGSYSPSFGLYRYRQGLRFVLPDDEGFSVRGDKQRLVYKGRRRSHQFTILDDCSFEYDCILEKEPESNVISLRIDGVEHYDFYRQPDFIQNPLLAGSYAVYKKQTWMGEGTGKLCHINRPEIIDSRGRRCWGDLSVVGDMLYITIPEDWLSEAKYPVIVDPVIGTSSVGSQYLWDEDPPYPWVPLRFEMQIPVNRFFVPQTIKGLCTAYFYTNDDDWDGGGRPVLYSDKNNIPYARKSSQEAFIDLRVTGNKPVGWRSGTFMCDGAISSGSNIWFGCYAEYMWYTRYDFGAICYSAWWEDDDGIPDIYPLYYPDYFEDLKLSMYFDYSASQNFICTLTQGVTLNDSARNKGVFIRAIKLYSGCSAIIQKGLITLRRIVSDIAANNDTSKRLITYLRSLFDMSTSETISRPKGVYYRKTYDLVVTGTKTIRGLLITVVIKTTSLIRDYIIGRILRNKGEIHIKSAIQKEIIIDSKLY